MRPGSENYQEWIDQARKLIKGDAHDIGKQLEEEMSMKSAELKFEEAAEIKRKIELLEQFKSKTIITNPISTSLLSTRPSNTLPLREDNQDTSFPAASTTGLTMRYIWQTVLMP
jgi:hypothetical protein